MFLVTFAFGDRGKVKRYQARTEQLLGVVWVILWIVFGSFAKVLCTALILTLRRMKTDLAGADNFIYHRTLSPSRR